MTAPVNSRMFCTNAVSPIWTSSCIASTSEVIRGDEPTGLLPLEEVEAERRSGDGTRRTRRSRRNASPIRARRPGSRCRPSTSAISATPRYSSADWFEHAARRRPCKPLSMPRRTSARPGEEAPGLEQQATPTASTIGRGTAAASATAGAAAAAPASRSSCSSSADGARTGRRRPLMTRLAHVAPRAVRSPECASTSRYRSEVAHQLVVRALGDHPALVEQHHTVGERDRRRAVGDDDRGPARPSPRAARRGSRAPCSGRPTTSRRRGSARADRRARRARWRCAAAGRPRARTRARRSRSRSRRGGRR